MPLGSYRLPSSDRRSTKGVLPAPLHLPADSALPRAFGAVRARSPQHSLGDIQLKRNHNAFTLIELLVVIAILAVLASILFPVFAQAKGSALKTTAMSNMKQIGTALAMYTADHDDHLFGTRETEFQGLNADPEEVTSVRDVLAPYCRTHGAHHEEPEHDHEAIHEPDKVWYSPADKLRDKGETSFAINAYLEYPWPMTTITEPSRTVYMMDRSDIAPPAGEEPEEHYSWWTFTNPVITDVSELPGTLDWDQIVVQVSPERYTGNVGVYLMLDTSARAMKFERTWGDAANNWHYPFKDVQ